MDRATIDRCIASLTKNNFIVHFFEDRASAVSAILESLQNAESIGRGGSATVEELGLIEAMQARHLPFTDYKTPEDRQKSFFSEYYLTSSNAITEDGKLVNIDGAGNRIAAISFGPKNVYIIAGTNKIVKDEAAGLERIRTIAAPKNATRLNRNTPCITTGRCMDCQVDGRICRKTHVVTKADKNRIHIFLINDNLGF